LELPMTATATPTVLTARALLLDMDGTLGNSDAVVERIWRRWAEQHGLDGDEVMKVVHGRQGHASMAVLLPDRPVEQNLADNARMLAEETADMDGVVAIPGAAGLGLPDVRVTAESVGASKPDPEGFLKGAAELGVAPADCVVFEDSGAGIAAGRAAGMRVVGIGPRAGVHGPDVVVPDLTRVRVEARNDGTLGIHIG
jgi:sugar-phosphatase